MAIIPSLRTVVFAVVTLLALAVLGISVHLLFIIGLPTPTRTFTAFGIAAGCITIVSLPLFFILGHAIRGACTSTVIFEIIWFFSLWVLWAATAGSTVVDRGSNVFVCAYYSEEICYEITVLEVFAFINFFATFFYHDVLFLYAIICAIRGKRIWTMSVRDAANGGPYNPAMVMTQPQYLQQVAPQYPQYPGFPVQQHSGIPQQQHAGIPQQYPGFSVQQYAGIPQQQHAGIPQQQYAGIPQQYSGIPQQQYAGIPQQQYSGIPPQHAHQQQSPGVPQVDNYTPVQNNNSSNMPSMGNSPLPPQPNHNPCPGSYLPQGQE